MKLNKRWCEDVIDRVACRGPLPKDYTAVTLAFNWIRDNVPDYLSYIDRHVIIPHRRYMTDVHHMDDGTLPYNLMLHIWDKPEGYNGDAKLLQKMYKCFELPDAYEEAQFRNPYEKTRWDNYLCSRQEFLALQHRKLMFKWWMTHFIGQGARSFIDVGCGDGWYTKWFFRYAQNTGFSFGDITGIDQEFPSDTAGGPLFIKQNVLKGLPEQNYDIVYSGGLFDYFNEGIFRRMLFRIQKLNPRFVMIGNYDQTLPTKKVMECLDWHLFDRDRWTLLDLGIQAFASSEWDIQVEEDFTKVQKFLILQRK